jgi:hypothetical protein
MNFKVKALGITLAAFLALGVAAVPSASAVVEFHEDDGSGYVTFEPIDGSMIGVNYGGIFCSTQWFHGYFDTEISTTKIKLQVIKYECGGPFGSKAVVKMNGCEYIFHAGETDATKKNYEGLWEIECPTGKQVEIALEASGQLKCTVTIAAQTNLSKITYVNSGQGKQRVFQLEMNVNNLTYTQDAGSGANACKSESANNGTYVSSFQMTGEEPGKFAQIGVWVA